MGSFTIDSNLGFGLAVLLGFVIMKARILTKCSEITPAKNRLLLHFTCHYLHVMSLVVIEVEDSLLQ